MTTHQDFLKFEAVLGHCEQRVPKGSLSEAMEYGREMEFFDSRNTLLPSGHLLAQIILPTIEATPSYAGAQ
jgi:hypothetical protein